jgi:hypothetical protein
MNGSFTHGSTRHLQKGNPQDRNHAACKGKPNMKKFILASAALLIAANFAPAAFAEQYKEQCAITHGNWTGAPADSCHTYESVNYGSHHDNDTPAPVARATAAVD